MQVEPLSTASGVPMQGPLLITPQVFGDDRPRFQERCHPSRQYTRGLEDMTNASLQRGRQG